MLAITITISVFFLAFLLVAAATLSRRHFLCSKTDENDCYLPTPPKFVSLFAPDNRILREIKENKHRRESAAELDRALAWASLVEFPHLAEISVTENKKLPDEALEILADRATESEEICALMRFVLNHKNLDVNKKLLDKFQTIWENSPDYQKTIELFEIAIRADDARLFQDVTTRTEQFIKTGKLSDLTRDELRKLAASHFWLLSANARMSGSGFWLKQKLNYN